MIQHFFFYATPNMDSEHMEIVKSYIRQLQNTLQSLMNVLSDQKYLKQFKHVCVFHKANAMFDLLLCNGDICYETCIELSVALMVEYDESGDASDGDPSFGDASDGDASDDDDYDETKDKIISVRYALLALLYLEKYTHRNENELIIETINKIESIFAGNQI